MLSRFSSTRYTACIRSSFDGAADTAVGQLHHVLLDSNQELTVDVDIAKLIHQHRNAKGIEILEDVVQQRSFLPLPRKPVMMVTGRRVSGRVGIFSMGGGGSGWVDGWMGGWVDGWMGGWVSEVEENGGSQGDGGWRDGEPDLSVLRVEFLGSGFCISPIPYSLFPIPYSLFPIPYSLFPYSLFPFT